MGSRYEVNCEASARTISLAKFKVRPSMERVAKCDKTDQYLKYIAEINCSSMPDPDGDHPRVRDVSDASRANGTEFYHSLQASDTIRSKDAELNIFTDRRQIKYLLHSKLESIVPIKESLWPGDI